MRLSLALSAVSLVLGLVAFAPDAQAQYKNSSFGFDVGPLLLTKPSVTGADGNLLPVDKRGVRIANGLRFGGETNFKMNSDHFWFTGRVNVAALQFPEGNKNGTLDEQFDAAARDSLGTLMGVEGVMGVRYVFLTDRFRPYLQASLSYMRLFTFTSLADNNCAIAICSGSTNASEFLAHPNIGGIHLQPGFEFILKRDMAFHMYLDMQRAVIFNADDNNVVTLALGMVFFT